MLLPDGNLVQFRDGASLASRLASGVSAVMFPDNLRPIKVGLIGDSIQNANSSASSVSQHYEANGIWTQFQYRNYKRFDFRDAFDKAVGGTTAQGFIVSSLSDIDDLVTMGVEVLIDSYGRNDISAGRTAAELYADRITIHDYAFAAGIREIWVESVKPSDYGENTAAYNLRSIDCNEQLRDNAANDYRKIFIDTWAKWDDGANYPKAGVSYDNIHATPIGGLYGSEAYDEAITPIYGRGQAIVLSDANLVTNGDLSGTTGTTGTGTSGDVADGFKAQRSGTTGVGTSAIFSKKSEGTQKVVFHVDSGNAANEIAYLTWEQTTGFTAGQKFRVTAEMEPISGSANAYWLGLQVNCRDNGSSTLLVASDMDKRDEDALMDIDNTPRGLLQTQDFIVPEGTVELEIRLAMGGDARAGDVDIEAIYHGIQLEKCDIEPLIDFYGKFHAWFASDTIDEFAIAADGKIEFWKDRSGNGRHATPVGASRVYSASGMEGGFPSLYSDGEATSSYLQFPHSIALAADATVIILAEPDNSGDESGESASNGLFSTSTLDSGDGTLAMRSVRDNNGQIQTVSYGQNSTLAIVNALEAWYIRADSGNIEGGKRRDLTDSPQAIVTTGRAMQANAVIGGDDGSSTRSYPGYIPEVLVFDEALTDLELLSVWEYIESKYGLT